eukprot:6184964-Pleurochrysis_carterae.AAC.3
MSITRNSSESSARTHSTSALEARAPPAQVAHAHAHSRKSHTSVVPRRCTRGAQSAHPRVLARGAERTP